MTIRAMYRGEFRLKSSPYPDLKVRDYPETTETLSFLENRLAFLLANETNMPEPMILGMGYKMEHTRETLQKLKASSTKAAAAQNQQITGSN
jgi:hypothetical protein